MFCIYCGRKIDDTSRFCQYCGKQTSPSPATPSIPKPKSPTITPAIIGLALSLIGITLISTMPDIGAFLGVLINIAPIILCSRQIKNTQAKSIAITGLCLSAIGILLGIAIIICLIASPNF